VAAVSDDVGGGGNGLVSASYPWHVVLELDRREKRIRIRKGEPICRVIPIRREAYFAGGVLSDVAAILLRARRNWSHAWKHPAGEIRFPPNRNHPANRFTLADSNPLLPRSSSKTTCHG